MIGSNRKTFTFRIARPLGGYIHSREGQSCEVVRGPHGFGNELLTVRFADGEETQTHRDNVVEADRVA